MKKLNETKQMLQDVEHLINQMEAEIELLRNINYRYYLMHGSDIQGGAVNATENISFSIDAENPEGVKCKVINHTNLGIESSYQKIKNQIRDLQLTEQSQIKGVLVTFFRNARDGDYLSALNAATTEISHLIEEPSAKTVKKRLRSRVTVAELFSLPITEKEEHLKKYIYSHIVTSETGKLLINTRYCRFAAKLLGGDYDDLTKPQKRIFTNELVQKRLNPHQPFSKYTKH
jgi:hypothetical protein